MLAGLILIVSGQTIYFFFHCCLVCNTRKQAKLPVSGGFSKVPLSPFKPTDTLDLNQAAIVTDNDTSIAAGEAYVSVADDTSHIATNRLKDVDTDESQMLAEESSNKLDVSISTAPLILRNPASMKSTRRALLIAKRSSLVDANDEEQKHYDKDAASIARQDPPPHQAPPPYTASTENLADFIDKAFESVISVTEAVPATIAADGHNGDRNASPAFKDDPAMDPPDYIRVE